MDARCLKVLSYCSHQHIPQHPSEKGKAAVDLVCNWGFVTLNLLECGICLVSGFTYRAPSDQTFLFSNEVFQNTAGKEHI